MVGVTYPPGLRGTAIPARTERGRLPRANTLRLDLSTARERERVAISGVSLWAIDGGDAEISLFLRYDQNDGIPFSSGMRLTGIPFDEIFVTNDAQSGKSITLLYTEALLEAESPARLFAEISSYERAYTRANFSTQQEAAGTTALILGVNLNRRFVEFSHTVTTSVFTFKFGSAPADINDGYRYNVAATLTPFRFFDDGTREIYGRWDANVRLSILEGVIA